MLGSALMLCMHMAALQQHTAKQRYLVKESLGSVGFIPRRGFGDLRDNFESKFKVIYASSDLS